MPKISGKRLFNRTGPLVILFLTTWNSTSVIAQRNEFFCNGNLPLLTVKAERAESCASGLWVLTFKDEFEDTILDLNKWIPVSGVNRDYDQISNQQWNMPENVIISDGTLKLIARKESRQEKCFTIWTPEGNEKICREFTYTSGEISTRKKFTSGMAEVRCKLPKGKGFFPAFWLYGGGPDGAYSEIDIFEFVNTRKRKDYSTVPKFNIHVNLGTREHEIDGNCNTDLDEGIDYSADFHVFKIIWDKNHIEWYIDGQIKHSLYRWYSLNGLPVICNQLVKGNTYYCNPSFPDDPMAIILDLAILCKEEAPDKKTKFPSALEIDYVRYHQQVEIQALIAIPSLFENSSVDGAFSIQDDLSLVEIRMNPHSLDQYYQWSSETKILSLDFTNYEGRINQIELINQESETVYTAALQDETAKTISLDHLQSGSYLLFMFDKDMGRLYWSRLVV